MGSISRSNRWSKTDGGLPAPLSASSGGWPSTPRSRRLLAPILALGTFVGLWLILSKPATPSYPPYVRQDRIREIDSTCRAGSSFGSAQTTTDFPIAHLVSAHHDESIISATLLLQEIYHPGDLFVVHIKAGVAGAHYDVLRRAFASCGNVMFVPEGERVKSGYANFSIIEMELAMIRVALRSSIGWKYALLMDGASWPAMPTEERRDWFRSRPADTSQTFYRHPENGTLISICPDDDSKWPKCRRTLSRCIDEACTKVTLTPHGSPIARAWQWSRISHELADWIINSPEMPAWIDFFKPTKTPDEQFFGTVHWASPYRNKDDGVDFMYVDWVNTQKCRWWPNPRAKQSPCYVSVLDVGDIVASGMPFVRKVASDDLEIRQILPRTTVRPKGIPRWLSPAERAAEEERDRLAAERKAARAKGQ